MWLGFLLLLLLTCWVGTAQATELDDIQDRGSLIVGVKDNLRPLGFKDSQSQLQGFEIELARQLATDLIGDKAEVVFKPLLNQDRLKALLDGEVDLLIARLTITDSRARLVDFSRPYFVDGAAFLTRDAAIQLRDLQQQRIAVAVLTGSDTIPTVRSLFPAIQLQGVASYAEGKTLLDSGQVAAFAADASLLTGWVQENPEYHLLPHLLSAEALAIAMPRGNRHSKLREAVDRAILQWMNSGWLRQQISTWGLPFEGFPSFTE